MNTSPLRSASILAVPAETLEALGTYEFGVVGAMENDPAVNNSYSVAVQVAQQDVVARIAGGASRQVGYDSDFTLDASTSEDPDKSTEPFAYRWYCDAVSGTADCSGLLGHGRSAGHVDGRYSQDEAHSGNLRVYAHGDQGQQQGAIRNSTTTTSVEIVAEAPPAVAISGVDATTKYNVDAGQVQLTSDVTSANGIASTVWSAVARCRRDVRLRRRLQSQHQCHQRYRVPVGADRGRHLHPPSNGDGQPERAPLVGGAHDE